MLRINDTICVAQPYVILSALLVHGNPLLKRVCIKKLNLTCDYSLCVILHPTFNPGVYLVSKSRSRRNHDQKPAKNPLIRNIKGVFRMT